MVCSACGFFMHESCARKGAITNRVRVMGRGCSHDADAEPTSPDRIAALNM